VAPPEGGKNEINKNNKKKNQQRDRTSSKKSHPLFNATFEKLMP
jgi:hypothetical protein